MPRKQDPKLVSLIQKYEVYYIAHRYGIDPQTLKVMIRQVGRSRKKLYEKLKALGFKVVNK